MNVEKIVIMGVTKMVGMTVASVLRLTVVKGGQNECGKGG
jgi:hypothetical protein